MTVFKHLMVVILISASLSASAAEKALGPVQVERDQISFIDCISSRAPGLATNSAKVRGIISVPFSLIKSHCLCFGQIQ